MSPAGLDPAAPSGSDSALFVSDVHADPASPATLDAFLRFLSGPAEGAGSLFVVGDLFETFLGPVDALRPGCREVLEGLAALVRGGRRVAFVPGNRDFPLEGVLRPLGVERLPDTAEEVAGGVRLLLTHGDLLCTRDRRYQAFRRAVRGRPLRNLAETLPAAALAALAGGARSASKAETARKAYAEMGLDAGRVRRLLARTGADALVCGHVHWGVRHRMTVEGRPREVFVLGAWEDGPNWLERAGGRWRFLREGGGPPRVSGAPDSLPRGGGAD